MRRKRKDCGYMGCIGLHCPDEMDIEFCTRYKIPIFCGIEGRFYRNLKMYVETGKMRLADENKDLRPDIRYRLKMVDDGNRGYKWEMDLPIEAPC